jgi:hypothetical protein
MVIPQERLVVTCMHEALVQLVLAPTLPFSFQAVPLVGAAVERVQTGGGGRPEAACALWEVSVLASRFGNSSRRSTHAFGPCLQKLKEPHTPTTGTQCVQVVVRLDPVIWQEQLHESTTRVSTSVVRITSSTTHVIFCLLNM